MHRVQTVAQRAAAERDYVEQNGVETLINSLSGGVDSAVSALISQQAAPGRSLALLLPCSTEPERQADVVDGRRVAEHLGMPHVVIHLTDLWQRTAELLTGAAREMSEQAGIPLSAERLAWAVNNLKPTLRMMAAGFFADTFHGLMMGTDNAIENFLGYFSIRGDGVADRQPIRDCTKAEVRALAASGGFPPDLVRRTPTAGLWAGQTDEGELGFTYAEADAFFVWLVDRHLESPVMDGTMTVLAEAVEPLLARPDLPVPVEPARRIIDQNRRTAFKRKPDDLDRLLERRGLSA